MLAPMEDEDLWRLLRGVLVDPDGWHALVVAIEPTLLAFARTQPIGRLRDDDDTPREIVARVMARLHAKEFSAIRKLCEQPLPPEPRVWLRVLVRRSAIDFMRSTPEFQRATSVRPAGWISLASLSSSGNYAAVPDTLAQKRRAAMAFVEAAVARAAELVASHGDEAASRLALEWQISPTHTRRLVERGSRYQHVLASICEGRSYPEIAEHLGVTRREVELSVRYLEELFAARGFGAG